MSQTERIDAILSFLEGAQRLKDTYRSARTGNGAPESVAAHSWQLCLMILLFEPELRGVDMLHLLKLCLVHDLGEAVGGDTPAIHQTPDADKSARERADLCTLLAPLPGDLAAQILALWDEYEAGDTPEAVLAKGFDKIETMMQHVNGANAADFDYGFNLGYGTDRTDRHDLLRRVRDRVDDMTRAEMALQLVTRRGGG